MTESKWFLKSKRIWGILIIALPALLPELGLHITDDQTALVGQTADKIFESIGLILATYGSFAAKHTLTIKP